MKWVIVIEYEYESILWYVAGEIQNTNKNEGTDIHIIPELLLHLTSYSSFFLAKKKEEKKNLTTHSCR